MADLVQKTSDEKIGERENAREWTVKTAQKICDEFADKYGLPVGFTYRTDACRATLDRILAYCEEEQIDPRVWLEAQFRALGKFFADKGLAVPPATLFGKNAEKRYREFIRGSGREATGNVRKQASSDFDAQIYAAEFELGQAVLLLEIGEGDRYRYHREGLRKAYPHWAKASWEEIEPARTCAAVALVEQIIPGASSKITPPDGNWGWLRLRRFLRRVKP